MYRPPITKTVAIATAILFNASTHATYSCAGQVGYLGVDSGGDVVLAIAGSTPIHKVCNLVAQGSYAMSVPSCKASHAMLAAAKMAGKSTMIYYQDNGFNCGNLPAWGQVPTVYFIQGPD